MGQSRPIQRKAGAAASQSARGLGAVELAHRDPTARVEAIRLNFPGLRVQRTATPPAQAFEYKWCGDFHYLGFHDLQLDDGETFTSDGRASRRHDLRGTLSYVPPGEQVWGWSRPTDAPGSFTAIYFDPRRNAETFGWSIGGPPRGQLYFKDPRTVRTMAKLHAALADPSGIDLVYVEQLALLAGMELERLLGTQEASFANHSLSAKALARVSAYVESHLADSITLDDLAQLAGLSRFHFVRAFGERMGETPYQFVLRRRVAQAKLLVVDSREPLEKIAQRVGLSDAARLIRTFRKFTGVTPGSLRNSRKTGGAEADG